MAEQDEAPYSEPQIAVYLPPAYPVFARILIALGIAGTHMLLGLLFAPDVSIPTVFLANAFAVVAAGWILGMWGGALAAMLIFAANSLTLAVVDAPHLPAPLDPLRIVGLLSLLAFGTLVGRLQDDRRQLCRESADRRRAVDELREAHDEMELRVQQRTAELMVSNRRLQEALSARERSEFILMSIAEGTSGDVGVDFFPSLVRNLAVTLNVRYAFVAECLDWPTTKVRLLAAWLGDHYGENVEYPVAGTPCQETVGGNRTFYARDIQKLFPTDGVLVELGAESYCGFPVCDRSGRVVGHVAILHDKEMDNDFSDLPALQIFIATAAAELHRKRAEEKARQRQDSLAHLTRLSTMGEMATGIAHELNQPLAAIATNARAGQRALADQGSPQTQRAISLLEKVMEQAIQAGEIIRRLRSLVRKSATRRSLVDINDTIVQAMQLIESDSRLSDVNCELHLGSSLPQTSIDEVQIQQVILNLIGNALDAMVEADSGQRSLGITTSLVDSGRVEVAVEDSGKGIPSENIDQIFDAFFTTKPEGLGMGLAISRSIIEEHGGRLWATPGPDAGSTFRFTLPTKLRESSGYGP